MKNIIDKLTCKVITPEILTAFTGADCKAYWRSAFIIAPDGRCAITNSEIVTTPQDVDGNLEIDTYTGEVTISAERLKELLANEPEISLVDFFGKRRGYNGRLRNNEWALTHWLLFGNK